MIMVTLVGFGALSLGSTERVIVAEGITATW